MPPMVGMLTTSCCPRGYFDYSMLPRGTDFDYNMLPQGKVCMSKSIVVGCGLVHDNIYISDYLHIVQMSR